MSGQIVQAATVTRRERPDGSVEYRCWRCGRTLIVAKVAMAPGDWIQAHCRSSDCKRERRFTDRAGDDRP